DTERFLPAVHAARSAVVRVVARVDAVVPAELGAVRTAARPGDADLRREAVLVAPAAVLPLGEDVGAVHRALDQPLRTRAEALVVLAELAVATRVIAAAAVRLVLRGVDARITADREPLAATRHAVARVADLRVAARLIAAAAVIVAGHDVGATRAAGHGAG